VVNHLLRILSNDPSNEAKVASQTGTKRFSAPVKIGTAAKAKILVDLLSLFQSLNKIRDIHSSGTHLSTISGKNFDNLIALALPRTKAGTTPSA